VRPRPRHSLDLEVSEDEVHHPREDEVAVLLPLQELPENFFEDAKAARIVSFEEGPQSQNP
jgi:hypothetical protein